MRTSTSFLWPCLCLFGLTLLPRLTAQEMSTALRNLWNIYHSDVGGNEEARNRAEHALATRPEFKPEFFAMLQRDYFDARKNGRREDSLGAALLSLREDLTPAEQNLITDELATHVAENDESSFIYPAINLLSHYPSPEHEALVLHFLNSSARHDKILLAAFRTLSKIGGEKSHAAMRDVVARMKAKNAQVWILDDMDRYLSILQYRLEHKPPAKSSR